MIMIDGEIVKIPNANLYIITSDNIKYCYTENKFYIDDISKLQFLERNLSENKIHYYDNNTYLFMNKLKTNEEIKDYLNKE